MFFNKWKRLSTSKKILIPIVSALLVCVFVLGGTVAYLISRTPPVENEFTPAVVSCEVSENFDGNIKRDVSIKNTGNTDAFIRAYVVANYITEDGKVLGTVPLEGSDFKLTHTSGRWIRGSDGFWYYNEKIAPEKSTENLIDSAEQLKDAPDGCYLSLQVLATAIQAEPEKSVKESWNVNILNGILSPK